MSTTLHTPPLLWFGCVDRIHFARLENSVACSSAPLNRACCSSHVFSGLDRDCLLWRLCDDVHGVDDARYVAEAGQQNLSTAGFGQGQPTCMNMTAVTMLVSTSRIRRCTLASECICRRLLGFRSARSSEVGISGHELVRDCIAMCSCYTDRGLTFKRNSHPQPRAKRTPVRSIRWHLSVALKNRSTWPCAARHDCEPAAMTGGRAAWCLAGQAGGWGAASPKGGSKMASRISQHSAMFVKCGGA